MHNHVCTCVHAKLLQMIEEIKSCLTTHFLYHLHNLRGLSWPKFVFILFFLFFSWKFSIMLGKRPTWAQ